jgi:hypothetical protein
MLQSYLAFEQRKASEAFCAGTPVNVSLPQFKLTD